MLAPETVLYPLQRADITQDSAQLAQTRPLQGSATDTKWSNIAPTLHVCFPISMAQCRCVCNMLVYMFLYCMHSMHSMHVHASSHVCGYVHIHGCIADTYWYVFFMHIARIQM